MGSSQLEAVADAGPLIHLSEIGHLTALRIFGRLHIPDAVWAETIDLGRVAADNTLLTDDLSAHEATKQLNGQPVGSLGVIVKAYKMGYISLAMAEQCIT